MKNFDSAADIFAPLFGRILMGGFFLWNGIEAALNFPATTVIFASSGFPNPIGFALTIVIVEVFCGIGIVVGYAVRPAALVLAALVFLTSLLNPGTTSEITQTIFLQKMAIIGGLLYISAYGAGAWTTVPEHIPAKKHNTVHKK